jgi:guanylate kinase
MGRLLTITGPSAGGKSTLNKYLNDTGKFYSVVSHTTRQQRVGEVDGVDYHFVTDDEFNRESGDLIERIKFHGNHYGAVRKELEKAWATGRTPVLVLDPSGLEQTSEWCRHNGVDMTAV